MAQTGDFDYACNNAVDLARLVGPDAAKLAVFKPPGTVRKEARERSQVIHDRYNTLHAIVARHEETIQDRWVRKSGKQKRKVLLECWPGMSPVHRPDFEAIRMETEDQRSRGTKYRESFMWPYINQADLSKPKNLVLLLNARARHHPSLFAAADVAAAHLGVVSGAIKRVFLNEYVIILNGATDRDRYGELLAWDDHPDAFEWTRTQKQFQPGDALLALEIQERILGFLLSCSMSILNDTAADALVSGVYPIKPEPPMKTGARAKSFESLVDTAAETPYRLPARIDFGRMELLLEAGVSAARDHICALREDPDYFARCIGDRSAHRQEMLKDTKGDLHPALCLDGGALVKARVIVNLVSEAYCNLEFFSELCRQAKELRLLHNQHALHVSPTEDLPSDFLDRLLIFRHYLGQAAKGPGGALRHFVPASPPMRKLFVRVPPPNTTSSKILTIQRPGTKLTEVEEYVKWLLVTLWEDDHGLFLVGMPRLLDELERLLQASPTAAAMVSPLISKIIGDASIIGQCLSQIDQYQPWARGFDEAAVDRKPTIRQGFAVWAEPLSYLFGRGKESHFMPIAELAAVSNGRFFYPTERPRTKVTVETLRRAEQNLDEFWRAVDEIVHVRCNHLRGTVVRALLSEPRTLRRTPVWVDMCEGGSAAGKQTKQQRDATSGGDDVESLQKPLSALYSARPPPADPRDLGDDDAGKATATYFAPIPVDSRALQVFRTLFYHPGVTSSPPGQVCWQDFVYAMTSTGLTSAEKLHGSMWQFQRLDTKTGPTSIQFHEPYLRGKIQFPTARNMGRRLTRSFGWTGTSFVLKEDH